MNARKGLKRYGMRSYIVSGPRCTIIITRERPGKYSYRISFHPQAFWIGIHARLCDARASAEALAGL